MGSITALFWSGKDAVNVRPGISEIYFISEQNSETGQI